jgi:hypothetical protein
MHPRPVATSYAAALGAALIAACVSGCLPEDTRPEPGSLLTTVTGSVSTREGVTTADGWRLSFDRALLLIGPMQLGDECNKHAEFSEPGYERLLDVTYPDPQKLSIMYGVGSCDVDFKVGVGEERNDVLLGAGVSDADMTFQLTGGTDPFIDAPNGVALHVEGRAVQGALTEFFVWDIRQTLFFVECSAIVQSGLEAGLTLHNGEARTYDLLLEVEALFSNDVYTETADLRFDPFADADTTLGNADGLITLDELDRVSLRDLDAAGIGPYGTLLTNAETLGEYVYEEQWRAMLRFRDTGKCTVSTVED